MKANALLAIVCVLMVTLGACAPTYQSSTPRIEQANVNRIQKGVSTMADVEANLGKPAMISLMGDGRRMSMYASYQVTSTGHTNPATFIPIVNLFTENTATAAQTQQTLQIIYGKNSIVEDYEFNDNATNVNVRGSMLGGMQMNSQPAQLPKTTP